MSEPNAADPVPKSSPSPLRRLAVWGGSVLGGLAVLVLVAALVLPRLFTAEQLKGYVVPPLEEATGRTVEIDDIGLRVLWTPAVRVTGFRLANDERFGTQPAVSAEALSVDVALWPLFTGSIEPTAIALTDPVIRYTVAEDGTTNFDTLGGDADTTAAEEDGAPLGGIPVSNFRTTGAQVHYDDRSTGQSVRLDFDARLNALPDGNALTSEGTIDLRAMRALLPSVGTDTLRVQDATLAYDVRAALADGRVELRSLDLDTAPLALTASGTLSRLDTRPAVDLTLETGETDLAEIAAFVPAAAVEGLNPRGTLSLNATVAGPLPDSTGAMDSLRVDGTGHLQAFGADYEGTALLRDLNATLALSLDSVAVREVKGTLLDASLAGHVAVQDLWATPTLDLRLNTGALDLATLAALTPEGEADAYNPQGTLRLDVRAAGPVSEDGGLNDLTYDGSGRLAGLSLDYDGTDLLRDLQADLAFSGAAASVQNIGGRLLGQAVEGAVTVRDPMGDAQVDGRLVGGADLTRLAALAGDASGVQGTATYDLRFAGPIDDPDAIRPAGSVTLANLRYPYDSFRAPIEIAEATVELTGTGLSMDRFALRTGEQTMQVEATAQNLFPLSKGLAETEPALAATFTLTADRLDLVELYPEEEAGDVYYSQLFAAQLSGSEIDGRSPEAVAKEVYGDVDLPAYAVDGRVEIGTLLNDPQRFENLSLDLRMRDRRLAVRNVAGQTYDGQLSGSMTIDQSGTTSAQRRPGGRTVLMAAASPAAAPPRPPASPSTMTYDFRLDGARASALLSDWTRLGSVVEGTLDLRMTGDSPLTDGFLPLADALAADGSSIVADGGLSLKLGVARALADRLGLAGDTPLNFKQFGGPFTIKNGALQMGEWAIGGAGLTGTLDGALGLNGAIDATLRTELPLSRLQGSKLGNALGDSDGIGGILQKLAGRDGSKSKTVPIQIGFGGTMSDPQLELVNRDAVRSAIRSIAKEEGLDRLRNLFNPGGGR